jgi:PKD repeat protein
MNRRQRLAWFQLWLLRWWTWGQWVLHRINAEDWTPVWGRMEAGGPIPTGMGSGGTQGGSGTILQSSTFTVRKGDLIILGQGCGAGAEGTSPTDSQSNAYTAIGTGAASTFYWAIASAASSSFYVQITSQSTTCNIIGVAFSGFIGNGLTYTDAEQTLPCSLTLSSTVAGSLVVMLANLNANEPPSQNNWAPGFSFTSLTASAALYNQETTNQQCTGAMAWNITPNTSGGSQTVSTAGALNGVAAGIFVAAAFPPAVTASPMASPSTGAVALTVSFTANPSGGVGTPYTYAWTFGDGGTSTAANPTHTYTTVQTFTATVTATDADSNSGSGSVSVTVQNTNTGGTQGNFFVGRNRLSKISTGRSIQRSDEGGVN